LLLSGDAEITYITMDDIKKRGLELKNGAESRFVVQYIPPRKYSNEYRENLRKKGMTDEEIDHREKNQRPFSRLLELWQSRDVEGLPEKTFDGDKENEKDPSAEKFIERLIKDHGLVIEIGGNKACFKPTCDKIQVPRIEQYDSSDEYYRTVFHELAHWTGSEKRLNRFKIADYGDREKYGVEELVAEIAGSYLCMMFDIEPVENTVSYLENWRKAIDADPYVYVSAGQRAEKVLKYLELDK